MNADGFAATGIGLLGNNMYSYCNNNPVCLMDVGGNYPVCIVGEVITEIVDENDEGVTYRTTIYYYIYDSYAGADGGTKMYNSYECTYIVLNSGYILFDNGSNSTAEFADTNFVCALAREMRAVTRKQVDGSLQGRTIKGIAFELVAHAFGSFWNIKPDSTDVTHIGSNVQGSIGYDYNADWFEHRIQNVPKIIKKLLE